MKLTARAATSRILPTSIPILVLAVLLLAARAPGSGPASSPGAGAGSAAPGPATGHAQHTPHGPAGTGAMTDAEMARQVEAWFRTRPLRGARSWDAAADTFLALGFVFDANGDEFGIDTVRIEKGQTVLWRRISGTHTVTSGIDPGDPDAGRLFDRPLAAGADSVFAFRFDTTGVFPFFCVPHIFYSMQGVVVVTGPDVTPPSVQITAPGGGETLPAERPTTILWTATDDVGVTGVDLFYRDARAAPWTALARDLPPGGAFEWVVHNTPSLEAQAMAVARDAMGNAAADTSPAFAIERLPGGRAATTLRDFLQPGTQPLEGGAFDGSAACLSCHAGYQREVEPGAWKGTMMAQAARDPLFYACLAIANQDAPSSGDLCLRCHSPVGWLSGRSIPTDGSRLTSLDRDGVSCQFCHRLVDPAFDPMRSPPEDEAILGAMLPAHRPTGYANGQYVVDPRREIRRGPFADPAAPHPFLASDFHRRGDLCGTCHDVSNPAFDRRGPDDYAPGPLDRPADSLGVGHLMPIERTYSEWRHSDFPGGVYEPEFAAGKPSGLVSTCQDCHEPAVTGRGCNPDSVPEAPVRANLPFHDMTGGNAWMPVALLGLAALYPGELDAAALRYAAERATAMLRKAAVLDLELERAGDAVLARVRVTNRTGHKLPTGYPEGRRMWLEVRGRDASGNVVYRSGAYDDATATLTHDADVRVYEAHLGLSPAWAAALGLPAGPSFHFVLNDTVYKDNRIPPRGFRLDAFQAFGGAPVDDTQPGPRYRDGQHWDEALYRMPAGVRSVAVALRYQTASREYVEFLRDENRTDQAGQRLHDLWAATGRSAPVVMAYDSAGVEAVRGGGPGARLRALSNPFRDVLRLELRMTRPSPVRVDLHDAQGRRVWTRDFGVLGGGAHQLVCDTHGRGGGSGALWARVLVGEETLSCKVVRLR